jgi:hypothetical protein
MVYKYSYSILREPEPLPSTKYLRRRRRAKRLYFMMTVQQPVSSSLLKQAVLLITYLDFFILNNHNLFLTSLVSHRYILYVSAVDQSLLVEDRRTSMAIVEVRIQGSIEDRPKREPEKLPQEILGTAGGEENQLKASGSEDVSAEAKRKVLSDFTLLKSERQIVYIGLGQYS